MTPVTLQVEAGTIQVRAFAIAGQSILVIEGAPWVDAPIVRFQSSCVFSESLHALDCDCGPQLQAALSLICKFGGFVTYAWEEGRGVGIVDKIRAIALQQESAIDTAAAFQAIGHPPEPRDFRVHIEALRRVYTGSAIKLATHNPAKIRAVTDAGFTIAEIVALDVPLTEEIRKYRAAKAAVLGHHYEH
jgi:GTP cyclohydrolase II